MATIRNVAGEERWIPSAGAVIDDHDTFEVPDELFYSMSFGDDFEVVEPPPFPDPAIAAAQAIVAADEAAEAERQQRAAEVAERRAAVVAEQEAARAEADDLESGTYDPSAHKADEVVDRLGRVSETERERIIAAERAGQARVSIVGKPADDNSNGQE